MLIRWAFAALVSAAILSLAAAPLQAADEHGAHGGPAAAASPEAAAAEVSAEKGEAGHHASKEVNPLEWSNQLAIWTAVIFVVLLLVLGKFAWGPIVQGLDKREQRIAEQIAQAEQANQQAKDTLAQYEQRLARAEEDVRKVLDDGRRQAEQVGRELIDKAKTEARAEQQRAIRQIDAATTAALKDLADRSASLAVELAGKIVGAKLNSRDHQRLIDQAVAGFSEKGA
jgi:F-type H+-transporting ATPase subunit b